MAQHTLEIETRGPGLYEFTREAQRFVAASGADAGGERMPSGATMGHPLRSNVGSV